MKIFFLLITTLSTFLIPNSQAYDERDCVFFRHIKPLESLNFLVCSIGIQLPYQIQRVQRINNEPIKGLLIGNSSVINDETTLGVFNAVTYYGLLYHNIDYITKESLEYLTFLEGLDVSTGKLAKIDYDAFIEFHYLRDLDLSKNSLDYLHPQIFSTLVELEKINLKGNQLVALESEMFSNNKKLSYVNLQDNRISYIHPRTFESSAQLRELYFLGNVCINQDFKPPRIQTLRYTFTQQCKETAEIIDMLSDKRNDAESINYEDERHEE